MDSHPGSSTKKRKGGIHQRLRTAEEEMSVDSCLFGLLMIMFAKGILSGNQVHALAKAGQEDINKAHDGFQVKKLAQLARLQQSRNLGRTVSTMMTKNTDLPMPMEVHVPMKGLPEGETCKSIMLPHEIFSAFYDNGAAWQKCILPDSSKLPEFWSSFSGHPCFEDHPLKAQPDFSTHVIPLALHGDEVPVLGVGKIWCKCVLFFSWFSLMSVAAGQQFQDTNIYIWGLFEKYTIATDDEVLGTLDTFFAIMRWSFQAIFEGVFPHTDWRGQRFPRNSTEYERAGKQLAGGWRGCLVQLAGDLDYYSKWFGAPRWSNHQKPCSICRCTFRGRLSWRDNRYNSAWQNATLKPSNYRNHFSPTCPLFQLPGFSSLCMAMDWMHCHHLGWLQYLYGSIFHILVFILLPGEELQNLSTIANFIKTWQKRNHVKHPYRMKLDKLTMFQPKKGYPKLRGRAADIAGLHSAMHALWNDQMDASSVQHRQIRLMLSLNMQINELLDEYSPTNGYMAVPEGPATELFQKGLQMASLHGQLLESFEAQEIQVFNLTSKTHFALHALQFSRFVHPYLVWCYKGESTMHRIQVLWKSCLTGSKHFQVSGRAALKERYLLTLQGRLR